MYRKEINNKKEQKVGCGNLTMFYAIVFLLSTLLVQCIGAQQRNPLKNPRICGRPECSLDNNKFKYAQNIRYKYDYRVHVRTEFSGSGENSSDVFINAKLFLTFPDKCQGVLSVQDVELREFALPETTVTAEDDYDTDYSDKDDPDLHPRNAQFSTDIQEHELRFAFHDGVIGELCPAVAEENWVLNFKRGILSSLQNTMNRFDVDFNTTESDISGTCDVAYSLTGAVGTSLIIEKKKDIQSCVNRYKTHSILQTTPYDFRKNFAIWPITRSKSYCNLTIDHNIYHHVKCYERHQLVPFSNNQSGAVTETSIEVKIIDEEEFEPSSYDDEIEIKTRSPLFFNHYPTPKPTHNEIKASRELLRKMCSYGFPDIQRDFIDVFTKFLQTARLLSHDTLYQLLSRGISICENGKNHLLESLPYIGSTASTQLMRDQIIKQAISDEMVQSWLTSLSYLPRPNVDMLDIAFSLINYGKDKDEPEYTLTTTAMAHTFCRNHLNCEKFSEIKRIVTFLESNLQERLDRISDKQQDRQRILVLLKGLGNIGVLSKGFNRILQHVVLNETYPLEIRLQGIYTHRRLDCESNKDFFLDIYKNFDANTEIRIASYLQSMQCPDYISIKSIKNVLKNEEVNQVGSYVWSHLNNLAKSSSPVRVEAQGLLLDQDLGTKYKLDIRKFSRNFEKSIFFDEYNFGANSDANLIFGTESYIPRTFSFNFTADLFGESVNLFEISARMQGFEHMAESMFGPKGPYSTEKLAEKFKFLKNYFNNLPVNVENLESIAKMRFKRETNDKPDEPIEELNDETMTDQNGAISTSIQDLNYKLKYNFNDPRCSFGLKVFGNDIKYTSIEGERKVTEAMLKYNPLNYIKQILSGKEITYTKSGVFLDASYDVPLISGLPLSIHAFGASSIDVRMSGYFKGADFWTTQQLHIEGQLKPSVSVDVIGTMQTDYFYGTTGIRVKSNLYTSSSIDSQLKISGSKLASVQFSLPQDRNNIFSARSEMIVMRYNKDIVQKGITKRYSNSTCTWPFIDRALGLKVCAEYSLPDVSNSATQLPSLILTGPINLNIHLDKADLTAKTFLFEYRSENTTNISKTSFVFHTPDSIIPRIFSANITSGPNNWNVTMSFRNGDLEHSATGTYRNTSEETKFEVYLNLDGHKNFALEAGYNRSVVRNGYMYYPKVLLTVNDDTIAGLSGTLKITGKRNIDQYDINLEFQTKRLRANLTGYVINTQASIENRLKLEYQFLDHKIETVNVDCELANRSKGQKTTYLGSLKLISSAYPIYNFATNLQFQKIEGHFETTIKYNNNNNADLTDAYNTMVLNIIFAKREKEPSDNILSRTSASIKLQRPNGRIDFKFKIMHEQKNREGSEHNIYCALGYGPKKLAKAAFSIFIARRPHLVIDSVLHITIPDFDSCSASIKIIEKARNDYNINFKGLWFSGHTIDVKGVYQDKSSSIKTYYHLKLSAMSPSFNETNIDMRYWRDEAELQFEIQADYNQQPYGVLIKFSERIENEQRTYAEVKFREKIYSITSNMMYEQPKQLFLEIHLDKIRDLHLEIRGVSNDARKEIGFEIQWDANRDPTQKFVISAEFNAPHYRVYDGNFQLSYPERSFSGTFNLDASTREYDGTARFGWSAYESIEVILKAGSKVDDVKDVWAFITVSTPFEGWRTNHLKTGFYFHNNHLLTNGSLFWANNQNLAFALLGDYQHVSPILGFEFKLGLNSTIKDVPSVSVLLKHSQNTEKFDTELNIRHKANNAIEGESVANIFLIRSSWLFGFKAHYRNVTGSVALQSPFQGYKSGSLSTKFSISDKRQLSGGADLEIEDKRFTLAVEGHVKKLTDMMLVTNITTPIEKFKTIVGRFGINERERHIVAEVRAPNGALGIELLFAITTVSDFDIKFNLETPMEAFEKVIAVGKMKPDTVEFIGGWNKVVLGFVGVWRHVNITDFEYSYKVFTALEDFKENGIVIKHVYNKRFDFDSELSLKLAKFKIGVLINGKPKSKLLRQLAETKKDSLFRSILKKNEYLGVVDDSSEESDSSEEDYDDEEDATWNFIGNMELYTYIWPKINGFIDVDEIGDATIGSGNLVLPQGTVKFKDFLYYPDMLTIKNTLEIVTPYVELKEIKLVCHHNVELGAHYIHGINLDFLDSSQRKEMGFSSNITYSTNEEALRTYDVALEVNIPSKILPKIQLNGNIEVDDGVYRGNISAKTINSEISIAGNFEKDEDYLDIELLLTLSAPEVPQYQLKTFLKRDKSEIENSLNLGYDLIENGTMSMLHIDTIWHVNVNQDRYIKGECKIKTNLLPITYLETSVLLETKDPLSMANLMLSYATDQIVSEYSARFTKNKNIISAELISPSSNFGNISFAGQTSETSVPNELELTGQLHKNFETYSVNGIVRMASEIPVDANLKLTSLNRSGKPCILTYSFDYSDETKTSTISFQVKEAETFIQFGGSMQTYHPQHWLYRLSILTSNGILSSTPDSNKINLNISSVPIGINQLQGDFLLETPWRHLGIDSVKINTNLKSSQSSGEVSTIYELSPIDGKSIFSWSWIPLEDMHFAIENSVRSKIPHLQNGKSKLLKCGLRYTNPNRNKQRLACGAHINVNNAWQLEANGSFMYLSKEDIGVDLTLRLPKPIGDLHKISGHYRGNIGTENPNLDVNYEAKYEAVESKRRFASRGQYRNVTDLQGLVRVEWGQSNEKNAIETHVQMLRKDQRREISARVLTPLHTEDTLFASGSYDIKEPYYLLAGHINHPASRQIVKGNVSFAQLSNMRGYINSTTPFKNWTWINADFDFVTTGAESKRYVKAIWPKDSAVFDLKSTYTSPNLLERDLQGTIKIEFNLTTRHHANVMYDVKVRELKTTGECTIDYNTKKILIGQYTCKSESRAGYEKDLVDITLQNDVKPIGITYLHVAQNTGIDSPHYDMKRAELYELGNTRNVNVTGEFHIRTTLTGQDYKIVAIHPNRTVVLTSDFDIQDGTSKQKSRLQLAPTVWIAYDLVVINQTKLDNDSQRFNLELSYPKRNLSAEGWYAVTVDSFDSDLTFKWVKNEESTEDKVSDSDEYIDPGVIDESKPRIMRAALQWRNEPLQGIDKLNQTAIFVIRHPSFQQDVTFKGTLYQSPKELINAKLVVNYCEEPEHLLTLETVAQDLRSTVGYRNYSFNILGLHEASNLDLNVQGSVGVRPGLYEINSIAKYIRGYLSLQEGLLIGKLDLKAKEILYNKTSPQVTFTMWGKADGQYPYYIVNGSLKDTPEEIDSVGAFYLNFDEKLVRLEVNMTPDASQNLQMFGSVPDARSASFDLWRDYEDIRVVDIAYYLRMNHSRLISSQLIWRPKMKAEVKAKLQNITTAMYETLSKNLDYWVKTLYTESKDTVSGVWDKATPYAQVFLDDVGGLRVLQEDIEEFRLFLNQSYEANDFYVKTLINTTLSILDELAIRDHIDSVPRIISEMWQALGESGKAGYKSLLSLVESIKTSYKKAVEVLSGLFSGEAMGHLSALLEKGVQKYDKFVKDLHLSFIKYVENIWTKVTESVVSYWQGILRRLEPSIIRFLHYLETVVWNISKEVFDFLYQRTNELVEAPYFHTVSNFTQDIDRLYKDLVSNDALTNLRKYTALTWQFVKEKYFRLVPFGRELNAVVVELISGLKKLQDQEPIRFVQNKINEIQEKIEWFADEFQVEKRAHQLWTMIINKINHYHETALQVDDKYRGAKTKFIFDPDTGLMSLEQKLPMSWHAFNETPKFEEIRELKVLYDVQEYFSGVNITSYNIYALLDYRSLLDTTSYLPPFKSYSLLVGSRHYMTFDKKFVSMMNNRHYRIESGVKQNDCSYLLAHDFDNANFTILLEPSITNTKNDLVATRKLTLITEGKILEIDIFESAIRIGRNLTSTLPVQIGDCIISREADAIVIDSAKGFRLNCNMKFDLCHLELHGWYFGKIGGILGNMNNEEYDDALLIAGKDMAKVETQWALNKCIENEHIGNVNVSLDVLNTCDAFFRSKISDFIRCFPIVDPTPYYEMCLDLGADSFLNVIDDEEKNNKGVCTAALAYMDSCNEQNVALRVPVNCIHCTLINGSHVPEGTFVNFNETNAPRTADIVFIVEAKPCNKDIGKTKSMVSVVSTLEKELNEMNITNNRYSVIAYGGLPPFDLKPRSIVYNNKIFSDSNQVKYYFDHIRTGASNASDTFEAISVARELIFRPGASKSFILLPCSRCNSTNMKFDFSTILQVLQEDKIRLHILMDQDFSQNNKRIERSLFGYDKTAAYTQKFLKEQKAEPELRKQVKPPKEALGECMPLAIESDGSIFTARKLKPLNKSGIAKKFALVFGKRVAKTAVPQGYQTCECSGHDSGMAYMSCTSYTNVDPSMSDDEEKNLSYMDGDFNSGEFEEIDEEESESGII